MEPAKVEIIGVGVFSKNHVQIYSGCEDTILATVADLNPGRARNVVEKYGGTEAQPISEKALKLIEEA